MYLEVIMATVEVTDQGGIRIPGEIRKKYRIRKGIRVSIADENGVITIRPLLSDALRLARKNLKRGA